LYSLLWIILIFKIILFFRNTVTSDIKIKTERDVIDGYEFESMVSIENHSLELISQLNSDKKSNPKEKLLSSNVCSKAISNSSTSLVKKKVKTGINHHKCDICDKILKSKKTLNKHLMTHNSKRKKPFICASCNKSYYRKEELKKHIIRYTHDITHNHTSLRYNCDVCGRGFSVSSRLEKHTRTHNGETDHDNDDQLLQLG